MPSFKSDAFLDGVIYSIIEANGGSATTSVIKLKLKEFGFSDNIVNKARKHLRRLERNGKLKTDRPFGSSNAEIRWTLI